MALPDILAPGMSFSVGGGISVGTIVGHVVADIRGFTTGISRATTHLKNFSTRMDTFLKGNATAMRRIGFRAAAVGAAVVAGVGAMVKSYGEFERRMRRATAVSDVSEAQFLQMSRMAEAASVKLNIAATQAADAFYYLGSAGLTASEQMAAFPAVATLSKAAVIDMDHAAEMMVDTIKAYRKSFDETTAVADIFTEAVISSNMTFSHLGETMALVGAIGKRTNNTIADLTAMIGLMANTGIKGSRAGTSLRRALLNLAAPSSEVRVELQKWGVEIYDTEGKMKPMIQLVGEFGDVLRGASEEQRNLAFKTLFGVRAITGQLAIFDLGSERVQAYADRINAAGGASERVAKKQMKAFMEQVGRVGKAVKVLARHVGESLAPAVSDLADRLKPMIDNMIKWVDANSEATTAIMATVTGMGVAALAGGTLLLTLAGLSIAAVGLGVTVTGLGTAIAAATLGIGALAGSVVYVIARIMKMKREVERLKTELDLKDEISELTEYIGMLDAAVTGPGPLNQLVGRLIALRGGFEELHKNAMKAMTATRKELLDMYEEFDLTVPEGLFGIPKATSVLREYLLHQIEFSKDMIVEMIKTAKDESKRLMESVTKDVGVETAKQMTIFEVASEERRREREAEYEDWRIKTGAWAGEWTEMEYRRVQATKDAIDDMEGATIGFFEETLVNARDWKDHFINFLKDIHRAIARAFADIIAQQIMASSLVGSFIGPIFGGIKAPKVGTVTPQYGATITRYQHGGVSLKPELAYVGEVPEAHIPLKGGRSIPVEMSGAPSVEVNVINQTSRVVDAQRGPIRFDGVKLVTEVILKDSAEYGPLKQAGIIK